MAAKQTAGTRLQTERKTPLKTAQEIAAEDAEVLAKEKFPSTFAESLALLKKLTDEPVNNEAEWESKQPRLRLLKAHVHRIQQGSPVLATSANDHASVHHVRREGEKRTKLMNLGRQHPEVKALLQENDELKAKVAELEKNQKPAEQQPPTE